MASGIRPCRGVQQSHGIHGGDVQGRHRHALHDLDGGRPDACGVVANQGRQHQHLHQHCEVLGCGGRVPEGLGRCNTVRVGALQQGHKQEGSRVGRVGRVGRREWQEES